MTAPGGKGQNSIDLGGVRISTEKYRKTRDEVAKPAVKGIEKQLETEFFSRCHERSASTRGQISMGESGP
jgi:hypothetical protein